jgi:hypothetical protein
MRLIFALSLAVAILAAADRPDFTGTWRLNAAQSNYPNRNAIPSKLLKIVEMKGNSLHYIVERELAGKSSRMDLQLTIGETDPDSNVTARWDGSTMVVELLSTDGVPDRALDPGTWRQAPHRSHCRPAAGESGSRDPPGVREAVASSP